MPFGPDGKWVSVNDQIAHAEDLREKAGGSALTLPEGGFMFEGTLLSGVEEIRPVPGTEPQIPNVVIPLPYAVR